MCSGDCVQPGPRATDGNTAAGMREITELGVQVSGNSAYCEFCMEFLVLVHHSTGAT